MEYKRSKLQDALLVRKQNYAEPADHYISRKYGSMSTDEGKLALAEHEIGEMAGDQPMDMKDGFKAIIAAQSQLRERLKELEEKLRSL